MFFQPERKPPLKPESNSAIRKSIKTNIAPIINTAKARNYSILIAHQRMAPTDIVKSIAVGETARLELAHLKTLLRYAMTNELFEEQNGQF